MRTAEKKLVIARNDYELIMQNIRNGLGKVYFNRRDAEDLEAEMRKALVVEARELPRDVVRLNSLVTVRGEKDEKSMQLRLVTPEKADIRQRKISILSPIGTALIGYRKGQSVSWKVPAGRRKFFILDVVNGEA